MYKIELFDGVYYIQSFKDLYKAMEYKPLQYKKYKWIVNGCVYKLYAVKIYKYKLLILKVVK